MLYRLTAGGRRLLSQDISNVIALQSRWTRLKTPLMTERGQLVSRIAKAFREFRVPIAQRLGVQPDALVFQGRDNTGNYSKVPWVRFAVKERSPAATAGWYCVLLFNTYGTGAYLCLMHGSNNYVSGSFQKKSDSEIATLMQWGRSALSSEASSGKYETSIDLGDIKGTSAEGYPDTALLARYYDRRSLDEGIDWRSELVEFAGLLSRVYEQERLGLSPDEPILQFAEAQDVVRSFFEPRSGRNSARQGFGLSTAEKKAVELHAMARAIEELKRLGFEVEDCSAKNSFDLIAKRSDEQIIVEVKGTTGRGEAVILTHSEVSAQTNAYPRNCLVVVHSIKLEKSGNTPLATEGELVMFLPWLIEDNQLTPTSYQYVCPDTKSS